MLIKTSESKQWTADPFLEKFFRIPSIYYQDRMKKGGFIPEGKLILDFGCGSGLITYGLVAYLKPERVVGVDLDLYVDEEENAQVARRFGFDIAELKKKVDFKSIRTNDSLGNSCYDCVLSWSVIEHIDRRVFVEQMRTIYECLKPNGVAIIQSAPLYYSPYGSHVYDLPPWSHLYMSEAEFEETVYATADVPRATSLLSCKNTLNRLSSNEFKNNIIAAGFYIEDCYLTETSHMPPERLLEKYNKNIIMEEQIVLLLRKS